MPRRPKIEILPQTLPTFRIRRPVLDVRRRPAEPASDLLYGIALHAKKRDLLSLSQREISSGERLSRKAKHRWWHAACLPEPSCSDSLRHAGLNGSILACHTYRDRRPEPSSLIASRYRRSTGRRQWRPSRPIRTPLSNVHRNLLLQGVATIARIRPIRLDQVHRAVGAGGRRVFGGQRRRHMTMLSPRRSTVSTRPRSSIGADHGGH